MSKIPASILSWVVYTPDGNEETSTPFYHLGIEHDGSATWLDLQTVKNLVWGEAVIAFEMYPPQENVVNGGSTEFHYRHLFIWTKQMGQWPNIKGDN